MGRKKKTHEEFVSEVHAIVGDEYSVCGRYVDGATKLKVTHVVCGNSYTVTPRHFLFGGRCPYCNSNSTKTTEKFKQEVLSLVSEEYSVIGNYVRSYTKIEMTHNVCNKSFFMEPGVFLSGSRCPHCKSNATKTSSKFKQEVKDSVGDEYTVLGEYCSNAIKIGFRHNTCGNTYLTAPRNFLSGRRCPICFESKGEKAIANFLQGKGVKYKRQHPIRYCEDKRPLKLDFYVQGVAIEYDGEYHYKPLHHAGGEPRLKLQQERDAIKDKYCADNGIPLIRIPYWDFDNIDAILTEKLLPLLDGKSA